MNRRKELIRPLIFTLFVLLTMLTLAEVSSSAEKFPSKEIIIIVPYTAGGPVDLSIRVVAEYFKKEIRVPVFVDNRPEAGGVKGVVDVYKAKPDGYTLLATIFPRNAQMEVVYNPPFKILELTYLASFQKQDALIAVNKTSPYNTLKELVEASKTKSLNCSVAGMGSRSHLDAMVLKKRVGINLEVVPFKGSAPALMALLGGNVDLTTLDDLTLLLQKEKLRFLAIFESERTTKFPEVPTLKELGYDIPFVRSVHGICGPPGLPDEIRKILSDSLLKAIKNPEFISKIEKMGPTPISLTGPEFRTAAESVYKLVEDYRDIFTENK